jgi:hypothetical protein
MVREKRSLCLFRVGLVTLTLQLACGGWSPGPCKIPTCEDGIFTAVVQSGSVEWVRDGVPLYS